MRPRTKSPEVPAVGNARRPCRVRLARLTLGHVARTRDPASTGALRYLAAAVGAPTSGLLAIRTPAPTGITTTPAEPGPLRRRSGISGARRPGSGFRRARRSGDLGERLEAELGLELLEGPEAHDTHRLLPG